MHSATRFAHRPHPAIRRRAYQGAISAAALAAGVALAFVARSRIMAHCSEHFVKKASSGNRFEIASSQLALQRSADDTIKGLAQQMINHHTQIGADLRAVIGASQGRWAESDHLCTKHQHILDRLAHETGSAFDRQYVKGQLDAHNQMIELFEAYKESGNHEELRSFAARTLSALRQHRERIAQISSAPNGKADRR